MEQVCECDRRGDPLASFCDDDLYCPQCGEAVAGLTSANLQPTSEDDPTPMLWAYPVRPRDAEGPARLEYRFILGFGARDASRAPLRIPLELDVDRCEVQARTWFEGKLEVRSGEYLTEGTVECVLRPLAPLVAGQFKVLPAKGAAGSLVLAGNCGDRVIPLKAFNLPQFRFAVEGDGVQADPPDAPAPDRWSLGKPGLQSLTIAAGPSNALLYLPRPEPGAAAAEPAIPRFASESDFRLIDGPERGVVVGPDRPSKIRVAFDIRDWPHGQHQKLSIRLGAEVPLLPQEVLTFSRQAVGNLEFEPAQIQIPKALFYGERLECPPTAPSELLPPRVLVRNGGEDLLRVGQPEVILREGPAKVKWLRASVAGGEGEVALDRDDALVLDLTFDLSGVTPENHAEGNPLSAEVVFEDVESSLRRWTLAVVVPEVRTRPPLEYPLAIDFGNTNTFAAVVALDAPGRIRAVLGDSDPETFPSALCFTDPDRREFEIGREAMQRGALREGMLVRGLKRELSRRRTPGEPMEHTFSWKGRTFKLSHADLIGMFLERILLECERKLRRTVTHMGLSYPANFGPRAIAQLDGVIAGLRKTWEDRHVGQPIRFEALGADEATAVALGFVLDRDQFESVIRPRWIGPGKGPFSVVSFDFGGGSIDCALIRFRYLGDHENDVVTYASEPLGIGGDEFFGGDNVTVAAYELLVGRLEAALNPLGSARRVAIPTAELDRSRFLTGSGVGWENTQRLWEAAEALKRFACNPAPSERARVANTLESLVSALRGEVQVDGAVKTQLLSNDAASAAALKAAVEGGGLMLPLEAEDKGPGSIYDHKVRRDLYGNSGYTVRGRIGRCVEKLRGFLDRVPREPEGPETEGQPAAEPGPPGPDAIVLAGAGCRVPLARKLLRDAFPKATLIEDDANAKSKVAYGLIRYLDLLRRSPDSVKDLGLARDYSHADIVWMPNLFDPPRPWIPSCSPIDGPAWYPLKDIKLARCWDSDRTRTITVHRDTAPAPEELGRFDLKKPGEKIDPEVEPQLPPGPPTGDAPGRPQLWLRIAGAEDKLYLRVELDGRRYGDWPMTPTP